jgi:hypothetical protein
MPRNPLILLSPFLLFLTGGCGVEASSAPTATVRDSAGVTIVENPGAEVPGGGGWTLAAQPRLAIGSLDGPEESQLFQVRGALRLPDGRIAIANEGSHEIRYYQTDGSHSHSLGGEGEGPGEFNAVNLLGRLGDSLVVLDRRQRRVSIIHPDQGFVRSFTPVEGTVAYPIAGWLFQTGSILFEDIPGMESGAFQEGFHRSPVPYASSDMEGALHTDFGELPGAEMKTITRQTDHGVATMMSTVPFGKSPQVAVAGDLLFYGGQDEFQIDVYGSDGALRRIIRVDQDPVPVTEGDLSAFIEEELAGFSDENQARTRRRDLEDMPLVDQRPPHGPLFADAQGFLFVKEYLMPGDEVARVWVFDPQGALVGEFQLPEGLEVLDVGEDYLLALYEDDYEVEYVQLFDLTRPGR